MNVLNTVACLFLAASLAGGQVLFKFAAMDIQQRLERSWLSVMWSPWLICALVVYGASTILWLWILAKMPLSRAYPFALLGTAAVPVLANLVFGESLPPLYLVGSVLVLLGLVVTQIA
jgi:drug/metabolite transporter (DMT)-like permease